MALEGFVRWPKEPHQWIENRVLHITISFTWHLPIVDRWLMQRSFLWDRVVVGGPALDMIPNYFDKYDFVEVGQDYPGVLQKLHPLATRTTLGCPRKCGFCAVGAGKVEKGGFRELDDYPVLPIMCDNNILAASETHFEKVITKLIEKGYDWLDFNQGIDARYVTDFHAQQIARMRNPVLRLACDDPTVYPHWEKALDTFQRYKIRKNCVRSLVLIGFNSGPEEAWERLEWVHHHGIPASPMWFHTLTCMNRAEVTPRQERLGWTKKERDRIMNWWYAGKGKPRKRDEDEETIFSGVDDEFTCVSAEGVYQKG